MLAALCARKKGGFFSPAKVAHAAGLSDNRQLHFA